MDITADAVPCLSDYTISEQVLEDSKSVTYRALQGTRAQSVLVKVLRNAHPSFEELVRFRNQYIITRQLSHPNLMPSLALERCGKGHALVSPDEGFIPLSLYRQQHPLDISAVLKIALQLADMLHYLIRQRVIHKDIKPDNLFIHPDTGQIQLTDFSVASLLTKEQPQLTNPNILEGTLAYMSPEQTGRMNRGIDYRTDFYAVGVTLFELLTGELPFQATNPMELVHCHIAHTPKFPELGQQVIPDMVEAITQKLMAKNAEERYQSALGLKYDLECCLQQYERTGSITPFEIGQRDICDRFLVSEKLYGRKEEE
ncbi:MAG: serine/threonine protein kinase, partial [Leptolyngbya sp. SIO3F4]|nr:serine/threonine protein kinase [Leptolyngbya sp. SIO3F4]